MAKNWTRIIFCPQEPNERLCPAAKLVISKCHALISDRQCCEWLCETNKKVVNTTKNSSKGKWPTVTSTPGESWQANARVTKHCARTRCDAGIVEQLHRARKGGCEEMWSVTQVVATFQFNSTFAVVSTEMAANVTAVTECDLCC